MLNLLKNRLEQAFRLTQDLVEHLDEGRLDADLPGLPSNRISAQLWCVVGARESYLKAMVSGGWQGFSCSLDRPRSKACVLEVLASTCKDLEVIDFNDLKGSELELELELAFALLEHEILHHGQLIRFIYGNGLSFPASWNQRYTV